MQIPDNHLNDKLLELVHLHTGASRCQIVDCMGGASQDIAVMSWTFRSNSSIIVMLQ